MGMFDYVDVTHACWRCGEPLRNFQSKDADCGLETVKPEAVDTYYDSCDNCNAWNYYRRVGRPEFELLPDDHELGHYCRRFHIGSSVKNWIADITAKEHGCGPYERDSQDHR